MQDTPKDIGNVPALLSETIQLIYRFAENPDIWPELIAAIEKLSETPDDNIHVLLQSHMEAAESLAERLRQNWEDVATWLLDDALAIKDTNDAADAIQPDLTQQADLENAALQARATGWTLLSLTANDGTRIVARLTSTPTGPHAFRLTAIKRYGVEDIARSGMEEYGLTPAESRLVARLMGGANLKEATQALNVKESTTRSQLKSIYAKTGVNSQSGLVALALNAILLAQTDEGASIGRSETEGPARRHYTGADDRTLSWRGYGDPGGPHVLVISGMFAGSLLGHSARDAAKARGAWLIAPDRPGLGESDDMPDRSVEDCAQAFIDLVESLTDKPFHIIANALLTPVGLEAARLAGDKCAGVLFFNPSIGEPSGWLSADTKTQIGKAIGVRMLRRTLKAPWITRPFLKLLLTRTNRSFRARQVAQIAGSNPADKKRLEDEALLRQLTLSINDARLERVDGVISDISMLGAYSAKPLATPVPSHAWIGADAMDSVDEARLKSLLQDVTIRTFPGHGRLMFHDLMDDALETLLGG